MKYLFFAGGSYIGGMEVVTLSLMKELRAQGHECFAVVGGWNDGTYSQKLSEAGIPHSCIKLGRVYLTKPTWTLGGLLNFPRAAGLLRKLIDEFRPDVAILTSIEFAFTALQVLPRNLPLILHVHEVPNANFSNWMGRYVLPKMSGVVAVSDFVGKQVVNVSEGKNFVEVVHNGVPFHSVHDRSSHEKVCIGIVGQLIPLKRHGVLVEAVRMLSDNDREKIRVLIYGNNKTPYGHEVAHKIKAAGLQSYFRWMGFVSSQPELYGELDLLVAPAVGEAFGLTVLEAGTYGLATIAARSGGFMETIIDGETGILVEPDDPAELARAILRLMDVTERDRLSQNLHLSIRNNFSTQAMALKFISAVQSFVSRDIGKIIV